VCKHKSPGAGRDRTTQSLGVPSAVLPSLFVLLCYACVQEWKGRFQALEGGGQGCSDSCQVHGG